MVTVHFAPKSLTAAQYDEIIRLLEAAGQGTPIGRLSHTCYGSSDQHRVVDVWNTPENFQAFGQTLVPIIAQVIGQANVPQPVVEPVHSFVKG